MKKKITVLAVLICGAPFLYSFCGFYVSKADTTLKNKTSQVILVRDGNRSVITMFNDFEGDTKDFAMVVPVPVILHKSDVKVIDQSLFQRLNDYSAPRLVEYYDQNPCIPARYFEKALSGRVPGLAVVNEDEAVSEKDKKDYHVKVEAQYLVGEYDIIILSAEESNGLKNWLTDNGYKIPAGAEEVLEPYIKSNLKFFVVKVNETEKKKLPGKFLRPIQISFSSPRFMLPIRLGMANAAGNQDLVVYAFTRKGRIECTNYRNVAIPTGNNVPLFIQQNFGNFYENLFTHQWEKENQEVSFLEYAWDVSPQNFYHCDPCIATAPSEFDLVQSGVWWLQKDWNDYSDVTGEEQEEPGTTVHFTRLHFRYNRRHFAQDLQFQVTPNTETFQARYVITHPATGNLSCDAGRKYLQALKIRRREELAQLSSLTGKNINTWQDLASGGEETVAAKDAQYSTLLQEATQHEGEYDHSLAGLGMLAVSILGAAALLRWKGII